MVDACIYDNGTAEKRIDAVLRAGGKAIVVSKTPAKYERDGVTPYMAVDERSTDTDLAYPRLYVTDIELPDGIIDGVIERVARGARLSVRAADSLEQVGRLDVRLGLSPIMLLHKLGVLDGATVVGGIYLDNDDVDLMVQCGAKLVLLPSTDIGGGCGIPNTVSYLNRGLTVGIGTGDGKYTDDVRDESTLLRLITNAQMCCPDAITDGQADAILRFV